MQTSNPEISRSLETLYSNASTVTVADSETEIGVIGWDLKAKKKSYLHKGAQRVYVASRLNITTSKCWDYSGIFYSNGFKVDRCISIASLGFYGPYYQERAIYEVEVQIEEFQRCKDKYRCILANRKKAVTAERGKIFYVDFKHVVSIQPDKWYTIKFQLDVLKLACLNKSFFTICIKGSSYFSRRKHIFQHGTKCGRGSNIQFSQRISSNASNLLCSVISTQEMKSVYFNYSVQLMLPAWCVCCSNKK